MSFVNLHVHTPASFLDGMCRPKELMTHLKEIGQDACAVTDHGVMYGVIPFYKEAKKAGIKPILGFEAYVCPDMQAKEKVRLHHLVLLAKTDQGYRNLMKLASEAQLRGFYFKPRLDMETISELGKGIIGTSACIAGQIPQLLMEDDWDTATHVARQYMKTFDEFYIEIQANDTPHQIEANQRLVDFAEKLGLPLVVTSDSHYIKKEDAYIHELLLAINTGAKMSDPPKSEQNGADEEVKKGRFTFDSPNYWIKSEAEVREFLRKSSLSEDIIDRAIKSTECVANQCNVEIELGKVKPPKFPVPDGMTEHEYLHQKVENRLFQKAMKDDSIDIDKYQERIKYELSTAQEADFSGYLLSVADYVGYARSQGWPVGPARGSAAGWITVNLLDIVEVDGIKHDLDPDRFIAKGRKGYPDIDVDFGRSIRKNMFEYIKNKYGADRVAQIATFGTIGAKTAIKDLCRVLEVPFLEANAITKCIPDVLIDEDTEERILDVSLADAIAQSAELREWQAKYQDLFDYAFKIEGLWRQAGIHAAGVVISPIPISDVVALARNTTHDYFPAIQGDMSIVEELGFIKYDFLGLKTLDVIDDTMRWIGHKIDWDKIGLEDRKSYELLKSAKTLGVFQVESYLFRELVKQMQPDNFADVAALIALGRPGPLDAGMDKVYISNKHGYTRVEYAHPDLEPILKDTYGIFLYQEQVTTAVKKLAGFTPLEADDVRKAMGKKLVDKIKALGEKFKTQAVAKGYEHQLIENLWHQMETFGRYGFNKAHSVGYGLLTYRTAWLKAHYPAEFMCAIITKEFASSGKDRAAKIVSAIGDARSMGLTILPPDINKSGMGCSVEGKTCIRLGLTAVKGVGPTAIEHVIADRPYTDFRDFYGRINRTKVNRKVSTCLIAAGAFDGIHANRMELLELYCNLREEKEKITEVYVDKDHTIVLPEEFTERDKLEWEKTLIGFYASGHPLDELGLEPWTEAPIGKEITVAGSVTSIRKTKVSKGKQAGKEMGFLTVDTQEGEIRVTLFPTQWEECAAKAEKGNIVKIVGKKDAEAAMICNKLTQPRLKGLKSLVV